MVAQKDVPRAGKTVARMVDPLVATKVAGTVEKSVLDEVDEMASKWGGW